MLGKAIAIVAQAFENKKDQGGNPYMLHCLFVMNSVSSHGITAMCVGVLHDLLEDCPEWTAARLMQEGFGTEVIKPLLLLTHDKSVSYEDYIKAISTDPIARLVKMADLEHNSNITRLKGIGKKDLDRMEKYHKAFLYLKRI